MKDILPSTRIVISTTIDDHICKRVEDLLMSTNGFIQPSGWTPWFKYSNDSSFFEYEQGKDDKGMWCITSCGWFKSQAIELSSTDDGYRICGYQICSPSGVEFSKNETRLWRKEWKLERPDRDYFFVLERAWEHPEDTKNIKTTFSVYLSLKRDGYAQEYKEHFKDALFKLGCKFHDVMHHIGNN